MQRIFLVGYMGAGKTTLGQTLSRQMNLSFIDLDRSIEQRYRKTVRQIFEDSGEAHFREMEWRMLREVAGVEDVVIATGGGTPCFHDNMTFMNDAGTTVYLKVSVDELAKRTEVCRYLRPVLQNRSGAELKQFITASLAERSRFYEQAAIVTDADTTVDEAGVKCLIEQLERLPSLHKASPDVSLARKGNI